MKPLISVIVPVYNTGKYLKKCLDSILRQTYENIEIIIVNDGSTDNSEDICKEYAKSNKRIVLISQENKGLSSARNKGITASRGLFLGFVDSDDYIAESMYMTLYDLIDKTNCEISCCGISRVLPGEDVAESRKTGQAEVVSYSRDKAYKELLNNCRITNSACDKLFQRSLFEDFAFTDGMFYEDLEVMPKLIKKAEKITCTDDKLYYYVQSPNSTLRSSISEKDFDLLKAWDSRFRFYNENAPELIPIVNARYLEELLLLIYKMKDSKEYYEIRTSLRNRAIDIFDNQKCEELMPKTRIKMFALKRGINNYYLLMNIYRRIK